MGSGCSSEARLRLSRARAQLILARLTDEIGRQRLGLHLCAIAEHLQRPRTVYFQGNVIAVAIAPGERVVGPVRANAFLSAANLDGKACRAAVIALIDRLRRRIREIE